MLYKVSFAPNICWSFGFKNKCGKCLAHCLFSVLLRRLRCWSPEICLSLFFQYRTYFRTKEVKNHSFSDAMSTPQIGVQFGEIHNNGTGGGNLNNSTGSVPESGYPLVDFIHLHFLDFLFEFHSISVNGEKLSERILNMHSIARFYIICILQNMFFSHFDHFFITINFLSFFAAHHIIHTMKTTQHQPVLLWVEGQWICKIPHAPHQHVIAVKLRMCKKPLRPMVQVTATQQVPHRAQQAVQVRPNESQHNLRSI